MEYNCALSLSNYDSLNLFHDITTSGANRGINMIERISLYCYHIHCKNGANCHLSDLSYIATTFTSWNGAYSMDKFHDFSSKTPYFSLAIIISSIWCIEIQTQRFIHIKAS